MPFQTLSPTTLLAPVPAVLVSCRGIREEDRPNLLAVAWAGTVNTRPPMVSVSIKPGRFSHDLIEQSGEFVINLVDAARCRALDFCGVKSGREVDKFAACGLTPVPAEGLRYAPAVAECPACLSCAVRQKIPLGSHDLFLAEVVAVSVQERFLDEHGALRLDQADLVCYNHGVYQRTAEVLGFFGYSVAAPKVLKRRMAGYRR